MVLAHVSPRCHFLLLKASLPHNKEPILIFLCLFGARSPSAQEALPLCTEHLFGKLPTPSEEDIWLGTSQHFLIDPPPQQPAYDGAHCLFSHFEKYLQAQQLWRPLQD